ncbi:hypothetical protein SS37A_37220 (plasmid) [Methylocystis iwaonis]|uniref:Uncharacterized protein n=1 Tax=Methylocystis iwaonis TaxID=2885079 RepID=A0ABM8EE52_9HYPH|nr:hypothetical protein SS37A_37220 [Methylocystis iwaonis]
MILSAIDILAVHDTRLALMLFDSAFPKVFIDPLQDELRLRSALAMNNRIVGVSAKPNAPQMAIHPLVEGIVQEQVRQQRRNDSALRSAFVSRSDIAIRGLHRRFQPAFHVQQDPGRLAVLPQRPHQELMIDVVEQTFDVELGDPMIIPTRAMAIASCADRSGR